MADLPIAFSTPMVLAFQREVAAPGTGKTMTRRLLYIKRKARNSTLPGSAATFLQDHPPPYFPSGPSGFPTDIAVDEYYALSPWQKVQPGTRLWVKEDLRRFGREPRATVQYVADTTGVPHRGLVEGGADGRAFWNWKTKYIPGRYCPRWASRFTLIVTATKIERLQAITEADCLAEGPERHQRPSWIDGGVMVHSDEERHVTATPRAWYRQLWDSLHGAGSWDTNPSVVALTFTVHAANIDDLPKDLAA